MTVVLLLEERPPEDLLLPLLSRDAELVDVDFGVDGSVLEETEVMTEPPSVFTMVTT